MYTRAPEIVWGREHGEFLHMPLTNSDYMFNPRFWAIALDRANAGCGERGYAPQRNLIIHFRDLFFSREYHRRLDFDQLWQDLEEMCPIGYRPGTTGRPELGRRLTFGSPGRLVLFEENSETVLSTTSSSYEDLALIASGKFIHPAIVWRLSAVEFLIFLRAVGKCLNAPGKTSQARLNLDVLGDGFLIRTRWLYHPRLDSVMRESLLSIGRAGTQIIRADGKKLHNYSKLWFGDQVALKQMMCWQDGLVRNG